MTIVQYARSWSIIEIETSPDYPDDVQAYAAGLLEGSLTWQLIHHHWYNTVRAACAPRAALCMKMRQYLQEKSNNARKKADTRRFEDPFWHMVSLHYCVRYNKSLLHMITFTSFAHPAGLLAYGLEGTLGRAPLKASKAMPT